MNRATAHKPWFNPSRSQDRYGWNMGRRPENAVDWMHHNQHEREQLKKALQARIHNLNTGAANPKAVMRANTRWLRSLLCEVEVREFPPFRVDEPPGMGGDNSAVNPMELMLAALGTCQEIIYSSFAALLDIPIDSVAIGLTGHMDLREMFDLQHESGAGFTKIRCEVRIASPAGEAEIRKLVETVERCCPVLDTLARPVSITSKVHLNEKPLT
jgi:uncharacterized OsmC-like protein